jgi:hypothetical protein
MSQQGLTHSRWCEPLLILLLFFHISVHTFRDGIK